MRWCPVPSGLIRHLLMLELKRLDVVLGLPNVCLPVPPPQTPPILLRVELPSGSHSPVRLPFQSLLHVRRLVRHAMPVSIGDEYHSYSPQPFAVGSAAIAPLASSSPALAAVGMSPLPAPQSAPSSVTQDGRVLAPADPPWRRCPPLAWRLVLRPRCHLLPGSPRCPLPPLPLGLLQRLILRTPLRLRRWFHLSPCRRPCLWLRRRLQLLDASAPPLVAPVVVPSGVVGADPTYQPLPATSASLS
ncbi:unnamed protein product [Closterium sp. NIES-65]|nr:unnamed protein product [Closterium sp. NIES-65]